MNLKRNRHLRYVQTYPFIILCLFALSCKVAQNKGKEMSLTSYVNPFIGTSGHGHTFPGAALPFGMVQLSPDTYNNGWDWCSGHHYSDSSIMGFSHTRLSGTGRGDLLDILLMPTVGKVKYEPGSRANPDEGYRSRFTHSREEASPGYYAVDLLDYDTKVELTTTKRVGFHKYSFPSTDSANVIIDLTHGRPNDTVQNLTFKIINDSTVVGMRHTHGWRSSKEKFFIDEKVFFVSQFSQPFKQAAVIGGRSTDQKNWEGKGIKAALSFTVNTHKPVMVKVGISPVDTEGAMRNLEEELPGWDFDKVRKAADALWEKQLQKIQVTDPKKAEKETFYTAMYHAFLAPYLYQDVDGRYAGSDGKIHKAVGFTNYTLFSLWDTFRSLHPLLTITHPELVNDLIKSMLAIYDESGLLPEWHLATSETFAMIGYHAAPVIVDAYGKGIRGFDMQKAYNGMKANANLPMFGRPEFQKYGYVPTELSGKSVSKTLEYAFDDWCILQAAKALDKKEDMAKYAQSANAYKKVFDPQINFMRGKTAKGEWVKPFDPTLSTHNYADFVEGNSWQYIWFVPHDVEGLIKLMGGKEKFTGKLDSLFSVSEKLAGENIPSDMTGFIGQYVHGNEPSHHIAYLYNYVGRPEKN